MKSIQEFFIEIIAADKGNGVGVEIAGQQIAVILVQRQLIHVVVHPPGLAEIDVLQIVGIHEQLLRHQTGGTDFLTQEKVVRIIARRNQC